MTEPKGEKPESESPHDDDFPFEIHEEHAAAPAGDEELPFEDASMSTSMDEFRFSGPAEELDFTEPTDFNFPTDSPSGLGSGIEEAAPAEGAEAESLFAGEEGFSPEGGSHIESAMAEPVEAESEMAGEGIADLDMAEEGAGAEGIGGVTAEEGEPKAKRKLALPGWVHTLEWVTVGMLATACLVALVAAPFNLTDPKQATLVLNIACGVLLGLIPYALWRSSRRWTALPVTAAYTVFLALSTGALVAGTWFEGQELSNYNWLFSKSRVHQALPPPVPFDFPKEETLEPPQPPPDTSAKDSTAPADSGAAAPAAPADSGAAAPAATANPANSGAAAPGAPAASTTGAVAPAAPGN